jgi:FlaA1/EpsC-like NDP-sugar epimerase
MNKRVIILGAGEAGRMVLREIISHPDSGMEIVGFLDDDPSLQGTHLEGFAVLGNTDALPRVAVEHVVGEVIIAVPSGTREFIRRVITLCRDANISFKIVPGLIEIIKGPVHLEQIRELHPEDLLGRETVEFDEDVIRRELSGRRVMVTGAGGSIGGEICRQIGRFGIEELLLLGRGENQIYDIEHQLYDLHPSLKIQSIITDIRDEEGISRVFDRFKPQYVYHAAAHKHVHYMEDYPEEAVKNNIFGTANIIQACRKTGVERLVMISTDKAVQPGGVMGATKRMAEYLMIEHAEKTKVPRLITVRFGNVLGSRGSVVPLFIRQIRDGGPVTVSDPEASRYFMTLKEACMLVIQASLMGAGGEIFILKMGSPIKIIEIAKDLIALHGLRPDIDMPIKTIGLRAGEKLNEALIAEDEQVSSSSHDNILTSRPILPDGMRLSSVLDELKRLTDAGDSVGIRKFLEKVIPDAKLT